MNKTVHKQNLIIFCLIGFAGLFWNIQAPEGLTSQSWHLFVIFITTIIALILGPLPMGAIALTSIATCVLTGTLTLAQGLSGFGDHIIWLVVFAFFLSHGFTKTGLGSRIAYHLILLVGNRTLNLSYALVFVDFILAPFIPSVSARGAGIVFPIAQSLCSSYEGNAGDINSKNNHIKNGGFLMKVCFQSNVITSAMFVTSMAANPLAVSLAADIGINISWADWAMAAIIPGITSLIIMPLVLYYLNPPAVKESSNASAIAKQKLSELGPVSWKEIVMIITFTMLIVLWIMGDKLGISATTTALLGLCILLITRVLDFETSISDKTAWHTFIWFATLVMLSGFLCKMGLIAWARDGLSSNLKLFSPMVSIIILSLVYFYIHYFFASATTHIAVLFPTFLALFIDAQISPIAAALALSFLSILSSGLTHYGLATAPVYFGTGYLRTRTWWYLGLVLSTVYCLIWVIVGGIWWRFLGLF